MDGEIMKEARRQIGSLLRNIRNDRNIDINKIIHLSGMRKSQILDIELNRKSYSIDEFLRYIQALDLYFFLSEKEGHHLNFDHMINKADPDKSAL